MYSYVHKMENSHNKRLWIGNLDQKVTEYQLMRAVRKFGELEQFDLPIHRTGPEIGKSKGYAFVSYKLEDDAKRASEALNGKMFGSKRIRIQQANTDCGQVNERSKKERYLADLSALAGPRMKNTNQDVTSEIRAIEKKLKSMESSGFD